MNGLVVLPAAAHRRMRWANGGGVTSEILVHPAGAGMDDFVWRASIAEIELPGPFSPLAGIDRSIAILSGTLSLQVDAMPPVLLSRDTPPFAFSGDAVTFGHPQDGPVSDFSIMTRRGLASALVSICEGQVHCRRGAFLFLAVEPTILRSGGRQINLGPRDCAYLAEARDHDVFATRPILCTEIALPGRI